MIAGIFILKGISVIKNPLITKNKLTPAFPIKRYLVILALKKWLYNTAITA